MHADAVVSNKGQVTLPAAMRAKLGLAAGSRIRIELKGKQLAITPELPTGAYYGMLKGTDLADAEPEKEPDRTFDEILSTTSPRPDAPAASHPHN